MSNQNRTANERYHAESKEIKHPAKKGKCLALEIVLSVLTILAINFLPVLHLFVRNAEEMELSELIGPDFFWLIGIGLAVFVILRLIVRKRPYFAGCVAAVVSFFLVNFSLMTSLLKSFIPNYLAASIIALAVVLLLVAGSVFLFLRLCKKGTAGRSILTVLCIAFVGLLLFNVVTYLIKMNTVPKEENVDLPEIAGLSDDWNVDSEPSDSEDEVVIAVQPSDGNPVSAATFAPETPNPDVTAATVIETAAPVETATPGPTEVPVEKTKEPNIYLLVFDEYGSLGAMEKYYSYNAEPFRKFMRTAHINWSEHSYSMTRETKYCMTDLNMMDYVSYRKSASTLKSYRRNSTIKKVFGDKLGYNLYQFSTSPTWFVTVPNLRDSKTMKKFQKTTINGVESDQLIRQQSIFGAFDDLIGALTPQEKIGGNSESLKKYGFYSSDEIRASKAYKNYEYNDVAKAILSTLDFWETDTNFQSSEKRMLLSYLKTPHVPFIFDEYGQVRSMGVRMNWTNPKYYYEQYIFITKHLEVIFKTIITNDPESIIIVMSDHGVRSHDQGFVNITAKDDCWIFLALYYQGDKVDIEGMSPINLMRLISTKLGVKMDPVQDYVTVDSRDDLKDVDYSRR